MKKSLFIVAFSAFLLVGCSKNQIVAPAAGETVPVSFTAALSDGSRTRASFDGDGAGAYADRCKLQIWWDDRLFYEKTVEVVDLKAEFADIVLIKDQTYDFLFWADNTAGAYYVTTDLHNVSLAGTYVGGKDQRDAFFAALNGKKAEELFSQEIYLYRPFAQLNVITTDIPALRAQLVDDDTFAAALPTETGITVTVPTVFNVKTGVASVPAQLTYSTPVYTNPYKTAAGDRNTLTMDYLFAPSEEGNVVEVGFSAKNATSGLVDIDYTFYNIPLRRNYRTNIIGSLMGVAGTVNVEIKPAWEDPDYDVNL